jgi:hypothetical protein
VSYRGRLLRPLLVEIERIDTAATEAADANGKRVDPVRFFPAVRVRAQVEQQNTKAQQQGAAGDIPDSRYQLVMHFKDLEKLDLVDANREPRFQANDRFLAIYTLGGALEQRFDPPLRVIEVQRGFGLGSRRNLCILVTEDRPTGIRS